ncbi:hypothetical protein GOP47_0002946 [Adiantum capillus-veneris]|uniref:Pectate lyase n=1 Tax=Adiantum capillus-veneris TaxID=13818 RepID=A0A9D4VBI0_ADICA|nr:hypothetical protein GOP47_0002946 [Adiantum capillus-veneris]
MTRGRRDGVALMLLHVLTIVILCSTTNVQLMRLARAAFAAAPTPYSNNNADDIPTDDQRQALPEDVMMKIENTKLLLQDGAMLALVNGSSTYSSAAPACAADRFDAVSVALNSVGGLLLEDRLSAASHEVSEASTGLSACQSALAATAITSAEKQQATAILKQAILLLQLASLSLNRLEKLPIIEPPMNAELDIIFLQSLEFPSGDNAPKKSRAIEGCWRDGTSCQFSKCGRGKRLPMCAMGFAYGVTGGAVGLDYVVTNDGDDPLNPQPGSLRYGVGLARGTIGGVWITFDHSMIIQLRTMLWIRSSTTIDGRGANIAIGGQLISVRGATNVILHNFQINSVPDTDTVHIFGGSTKVWVDHMTSFDAVRGLISVLKQSTDVTISNCKLWNPNFNMLLGASDSDIGDKNMRVTIYRNWFKDSKQRMPHCRWGFCHVTNNLYTNWGFYAIGGRVYANILSESNVFIPGMRQEVTPWFPGANLDPYFDDSAHIVSHNDLFLNGATFHQFNQSFLSNMDPPYASSASYPPLHSDLHALPDFLGSCSGAIVEHSILAKCRDLVGFQ